MTEGKKFDGGKPPVSLISDIANLAEAEVLDFGAYKYGRHNWRQGLEWSRIIDAVLRHIHAFNNGEDLDPETGFSHIAHARAGLGFLLEYLETHKELDDRYVKPKQEPDEYMEAMKPGTVVYAVQQDLFYPPREGERREQDVSA